MVGAILQIGLIAVALSALGVILFGALRNVPKGKKARYRFNKFAKFYHQRKTEKGENREG